MKFQRMRIGIRMIDDDDGACLCLFVTVDTFCPDLL